LSAILNASGARGGGGGGDGFDASPRADLCLLRVRRRPNGPEPAREWDGLPPSSLRLLPSFFFPWFNASINYDDSL